MGVASQRPACTRSSPKGFEKRVVFRIARAGAGWRVIGAAPEPVDVGEELTFRIEVVKHNEQEPGTSTAKRPRGLP